MTFEVPGPVGATGAGSVIEPIRSAEPLEGNWWDGHPDSGVRFHPDGVIGWALREMGPARRWDVDGHALGNVLGWLATDVLMCRRTAQEGVERYKALRDRLPEGRARTALSVAIEKIDAPKKEPPPLPPGTPGPVRRVVTALNAQPLVRREPEVELEPLVKLAQDYEAKRIGPARLSSEVRDLAGRRHEVYGDSGKSQIDFLLRAASEDLAAMYPELAREWRARRWEAG
jgi:hypothetical protein